MKLYQVDAFTARPFAGNPAAVCIGDGPVSEPWMARVAAEMNLSETAFLHPMEDGFGLRWFTPATEVALCGHATLASAHALWESGTAAQETLRFHTRSGVLRARRRDAMIEIELPAMSLEACALPDEVRSGLGVEALHVARTPDRGLGERDYLVEVASEEAVLATRPDFPALRRVTGGFIVTARSASAGRDFVSRYFAPAAGIDEDPVTGAAHCALVPFWTGRLGKRDLVGYQASARGGMVHGRLEGDRVLLAGHAVTVVRGELTASEDAS